MTGWRNTWAGFEPLNTFTSKPDPFLSSELHISCWHHPNEFLKSLNKSVFVLQDCNKRHFGKCNRANHINFKSTQTLCKLQLYNEKRNIKNNRNKTNRSSTGSAQSSKSKKEVHIGLGYHDMEQFMLTRSGHVEPGLSSVIYLLLYDTL